MILAIVAAFINQHTIVLDVGGISSKTMGVDLLDQLFKLREV
jgi:hypothetical protein